MPRPRKGEPTDVVFSAAYEVARVITVKCRARDGSFYYRSTIRFDRKAYAAVDSRTKKLAEEAHDELGAYCLGLDKRMRDRVARARADALAETRALLQGKPLESATEIEQINAAELQAKLLRDNRPKI